jgi:hypothetical protein
VRITGAGKRATRARVNQDDGEELYVLIDSRCLKMLLPKALVIALLIVSAAIVPSLPTVAGFPDRSSELPRAATSPLFRHIWDNKLLSSEVEDWIPAHSDNYRESEWTPESRNVQTRLFFQADLKPTFEGSLSAVGEYDGVQLSGVPGKFCTSEKHKKLA